MDGSEASTLLALASKPTGVLVQTQLTLEALLNTSSWNLPGWNNNDPIPIPSTEQLNSLDQSLALLAQYRNSLRPFNRLSSDILLMIFEEIMSEYGDPFHALYGSYDFFTFAKVCHSWRQLVLATPALWRQISARYPSAALTALERCGDAGFFLVIPEGTPQEIAEPVIKAVANEAHRLRELYLPSNILKREDGSMDPMLQPLVDTPAPLLERIETIKVKLPSSDTWTSSICGPGLRASRWQT
ncbi:hypothetical protein NM688_g9339 [Phlebia brevispora]|uniref:Uncharacterized protein n=1 Tax=Phlebia brevispora TaxID=194682 RepID=A0ACC1RHF7_9APHY|nr:hypothetical protein NM688_g9339 [Phlebia brevispora]